MCGVNCIYDPYQRQPTKADLVHRMNAQMIYRGPDDEGVYCDDDVALGMRRLSIIDVAGGRQPLFNEDRSLVLICNGEIYNYLELMQDLRARGHYFTSGSDAETILHLYEERGEQCLDFLRGMFAFVLWDRRRRKLFAARDRLGIKPLYLAEQDGVFWLSSELKAIVNAARISPTLRPDTAYQFLLYGYAIDQRHTVIEQVERVLPGEYLIADSTGLRRYRYWLPRFGGDHGLVARSDAEIVDTLETAVKLHLRSDVPIGILLSGGIDSSAVAAFAARSGGNYLALCAGYPGRTAVDERNVAHATARGLGLDHRDIILDSASYDRYFDEVVGGCDEPVGDPAAMPQWALYESARRMGCKVVLSGIGGDELFFGYQFWNQVAADTRTMAAAARVTWSGLDQRSSWQYEWTQLQTMMRPSTAMSADQLNRPLFELRDEAPWGVDAMASVLLGTYLVHNGCFLADKLGMSCSVEVRVPFLDHTLVESVLALPLAQRFSVTSSKPLLKRVLRGIVPDGVLDAHKRGFTPPAKHTERLVLSRHEQICDGILGQELLKRDELESLYVRVRAHPWLTVGRIRLHFGLDRPVEFLLRMIALEAWWATLLRAPAYSP